MSPPAPSRCHWVWEPESPRQIRLTAVVNTTCSYPQVIAALNATNPGAAAQFNASPVAQSYLQRFLASPPPQRAAMAAQLQAMPGASQYIGVVGDVAGVCNGY